MREAWAFAVFYPFDLLWFETFKDSGAIQNTIEIHTDLVWTDLTSPSTEHASEAHSSTSGTTVCCVCSMLLTIPLGRLQYYMLVFNLVRSE